MNELTVNATYTTQTVVTKQNVAAAVASGLLEVFSTPMLAALMEEAAYKLAQECLAEGQTTVGSRIDINHTAATPLGGVVRATATLTAVEGRKLCFRILAEDAVGQVGDAYHERYIIDAARFMAKAEGRK